MIDVKAFLVLEASLSALVAGEASKRASGVISKVVVLAEEGDFLAARAVLRTLSLASMFDGDEEPLLYHTTLAMLFGASRVTQVPGTSVVGMGFERQSAKQMVLSFLQTLRQKTAEQLIATGLRRLDAMEVLFTAHPKVLVEAPALKAERILAPFDSFMDGAGQAYFNMVSSLHTSRVSAYGFTAEAAALGYTEYQINEQLDSRTCPVCRLMHGKRFKVSDARSLLNVVTRTSDPDDLKQLQPWPSHSPESLASMGEMSSAELVAKGWHVPPFHPRCRGLLGVADRVPTLAQLDSGKVNEPYTSGASDFKQLGLPPSKANITQWNANIPMSPVDLVARLTMLGPEELVVQTGDSKAPKKTAGITSFSLGESLKLSLSKPMLGLDLPVKQSVEYSFKTKELLLTKVAYPKGAQASHFKQHLVEVYALAKDMGASSVAVPSAGDLGAHALAKFGFKPDATGWSALQEAVASKAEEFSLFSILPKGQAKALSAILASADPSAVFSLADLPFGPFLLGSSPMAGALDLADGESVTRFLTYIGALK